MNLTDAAYLFDVLSGPGGSAPPDACRAPQPDFNEDGDVDLSDVAAFQRSFPGVS